MMWIKNLQKDGIFYLWQCFPNFLSLQTKQKCKIFFGGPKKFKINPAEHKFEIKFLNCHFYGKIASKY